MSIIPEGSNISIERICIVYIYLKIYDNIQKSLQDIWNNVENINMYFIKYVKLKKKKWIYINKMLYTDHQPSG